jgi:Fe2+ transport system protein FeoA
MAAGTVAELPAGARGVVARLQGDPELLTRLTAQGLAPGVALHLLQRSPTYVIEVGETTIALERRVAEAIVLRDPDERR